MPQIRFLAAGLAVPVLAVGVWVQQSTPGDRPATRTYYIAAEEVEWDYAPTGSNRAAGRPFDDMENFWMAPSAERVGRVYRKAIYREYADATFSTRKPRPAEWEHLGFLGPVIRATVGDTIRVVFKNNATRPHTVHPHGVFYDKASEGAPYADLDDQKADDGVAPGTTQTYVWLVPERAGPTHAETNSILWMYHSHVVESMDVASGLIGPMIITRRGGATREGTPKGIDREFVVALAEMDENMSWYIDHNIVQYASEDALRLKSFDFFDPFRLSNVMLSINGYVFGHVPNLMMQQGERVRWYLFATTGFEIHNAHWHGQTTTVNHMRTDAVGLVTMQMVVADMQPDNPGRWLLHCHVGPHNDGGMQAVFDVVPRVAAR